ARTALAKSESRAAGRARRQRMAGRPRRAGGSPRQRRSRTRPGKNRSRVRKRNHYVLRRRLSLGAHGGRGPADGLSQRVFAHRRLQGACRGQLADDEMISLETRSELHSPPVVSGFRQSRKHGRMNDSKLYGPSANRQISGEVPTLFAQRASPSPSPRPSLSGRGRILRWRLAQPSAVSSRRTSRITGPAADCSLSPWERVRVRGIGLPLDTATRTLPEIVELRVSSGRVPEYRSADFQSALSPICNRPSVGPSQDSGFCGRSAGYKLTSLQCERRQHCKRILRQSRRIPMTMKNLFVLLALLTLPISALAQKKPGEAASIGKVEIQGDAKPGDNVVATVQVKLEKAWHVQSNKPSEPNFIPTVLTLAPTPGVKVTAIKYPEGKAEK